MSGLCLGYEDLNDHNELRRDVLLQTTVERDTPLASAPTLCRLENRASRAVAWRQHEVIVERLIASFREAPREVALDFDAAKHARAILALPVKRLRREWPPVKIILRADAG